MAQHIAKNAIRQLIRMMLLMLCASLVAFGLLCLSPIDPLQQNVGQAALGSMSPEQIEKLQDYWGVNTPPAQRFGAWASGIVRGDFGTSLIYRQPVLTVIGAKLENSLWLLVFSWIISGVVGFALGVVAGAFQGRWPDRMIHSWSMIIASTPAFWVALLFLMIFGVWLGVLPVGLSVPIGLESAAVTVADRLRHAVLPALALSITGIASIALHTREKMIEVMRSDYVLFARARGESQCNVVLRRALRSVALPAITLQFVSLGEVIGSSVLIEQVFSYPGLGQAAVQAGLGSDLPLLLGITVVCSGLVFLGNFMADCLYSLADPRIREGVGR